MSKLMVMCGVSGSGKSTVAKELCHDSAIIVSSDNIRLELWGNAADQQKPEDVFNLMREKAIAGLRDGKDVIFDSTNLASRRRSRLLNKMTRDVHGIKTELHIVLAPPEQCIANQLTRDRQVPSDVIYKQATSFAMPALHERWTEPVQIHNAFFKENYMQQLIDATKGFSQLSVWHQETVDMHQEMVKSYAISHGFADIVCEVAGYHDIGKPGTHTVDENGNAHFRGHAHLGAYLYLCANARTGVLSPDVWQRAMLIDRHMDLMYNIKRNKLIAAVGGEMTKYLEELREADENGAIRIEQLKNMPVLEFMNTFPDWEERIHQSPFCVTTKWQDDYVLLQYQQLNSDFSQRIVQESRGSIFRKDESGKWMYVCRPFDKFFNHGQSGAAEIDWTTARVLSKVDGAYMKLWYDRDAWHLSTNGTIDAFKANVADLGYTYGDVFVRALGRPLDELCAWLDPKCTYMFELTAQDIRVVIDYPDGVWYLSRRDTQTGQEFFNRPALPGVKYPDVWNLSNVDQVIAVVSGMSKDEEGVVINDAHGNRLKVKSPEYLMSAHLINNHMVSNRNLVIYMQEGRLDDFVAYCPEYTPRVEAIREKFNDMCRSLEAEWDDVSHMCDGPRIEFAQAARKHRHSGFLFSKLEHPQQTAEEYLLSLRTPSLMRTLGLRAAEETEPERLEQEEEEVL